MRVKHKFLNRKTRKEWYRIVRNNNLNPNDPCLPIDHISEKLTSIVRRHNDRQFKKFQKENP